MRSSTQPHEEFIDFFYSDQLQEEVKNEYQRLEEMKIKDAIGFRHVIDLLSVEQKLIIGHNCFLGTNISQNFIKRLF